MTQKSGKRGKNKMDENEVKEPVVVAEPVAAEPVVVVEPEVAEPEAEKEKAVELDSIAVDFQPDLPTGEGKRVLRDIRVGDKKRKLSIPLFVPADDAESMRVYNLPLATLVAKGVKQHSYDSDGALRKFLKENHGASDEELIAETQKLQVELWFDPASKTRQSSVVKAAAKEDQKKLASAKNDLGLTTEQIIELARKQLASQNQ